MAERSLIRSIELFRDVKDGLSEAVWQMELGLLLGYEGRFDEAESELNTALKTYREGRHRQLESVAQAYLAILAMLRGNPEGGCKTARESRRLADVESYERDIIWADGLLVWGL